MKSKVLKELANEGIRTLTEYEAKEVLREYDIPCSREVLIEYEEGKKVDGYLNDLKSKKERPDYPIFLKVSSRDILHKTDARVIGRANSDEEAVNSISKVLKNAKSYDEKAEIQGVLASEDVSGEEAREMILGSTHDEQFGHLLSLGIGGIATEVYEDVEFRAIPLEGSDVRSMVRNLKGRKMLGEFRGKRPIDLDSLVNTALKFSKLIQENPEIMEADINPLFAGPDRIVGADALIRIE